MEEQKIGVVTHYYNHIGVGIIKIEEGVLKVGDKLHIKGHTTDLEQTVDSLQIEHKDLTEAKVGDMVGIKLKDHVREHDEVFKLIKQQLRFYILVYLLDLHIYLRFTPCIFARVRDWSEAAGLDAADSFALYWLLSIIYNL